MRGITLIFIGMLTLATPAFAIDVGSLVGNIHQQNVQLATQAATMNPRPGAPVLPQADPIMGSGAGGAAQPAGSETCHCPKLYKVWGNGPHITSANMTLPGAYNPGNYTFCVFDTGNNGIYDTESYMMNVPCEAPPAAAAVTNGGNGAAPAAQPKSATFSLSISANVSDEEDCNKKVGHAISGSHRLIPSGSAAAIRDSRPYCKNIFPDFKSPSQQVVMASTITVESAEECITSLNKARGYGLTMKKVEGNQLEELDSIYTFCWEKFGIPGKVDPEAAANLDNKTRASTVKIDSDD